MKMNGMRVSKEGAMNLSGRSIEVVVGPPPSVTFSVHENLICESSDFFNKAVRGSWRESKDRLIRLQSDSPDVFNVYLHWLYYHTFPVRIDEPGPAGNAEYLQLAKAYILGDMLQDGSFKDAVIDAMIDKTNSKALDGLCWYPVGPVIRLIYDNTLESSKARRFLVDIYVLHGEGDWLKHWAVQDDLPKEFLFDIAVAVLDERPQPEHAISSMPSPCKYHEHGPDASTCYKNILTSTSKIG